MELSRTVHLVLALSVGLAVLGPAPTASAQLHGVGSVNLPPRNELVQPPSSLVARKDHGYEEINSQDDRSLLGARMLSLLTPTEQFEFVLGRERETHAVDSSAAWRARHAAPSSGASFDTRPGLRLIDSAGRVTDLAPVRPVIEPREGQFRVRREALTWYFF